MHDELGARLAPGEIRVRFWPARIELLTPALELDGGARLELSRARIDVSTDMLFEPARTRLRGLSVSGPAQLRHPQLELAGSLELALVPAAEAESPGRWSVRGEATLDSGGVLEVDGGVSPDGSFDGRLDLDGVEATPFSALLAGSSREGPGPQARGRHSGSFELPADGGGIATLRLASDDATLRIAEVALSGPISLVAEIPLSSPFSSSSSSSSSGSVARGRFSVDASRARVEYADGLARAAGSGASLRGRIGRTREGQLQLDELTLEVERFEGGAIGGDPGE